MGTVPVVRHASSLSPLFADRSAQAVASDPADIYKAWADALEDSRPNPNSIHWQTAMFASSDTRIFFVVDGFHSTSVFEKFHWSERIRSLVTAAGCKGTVRAFSYAGYGLNYLPELTRRSLVGHRLTWLDYMNRIRNNQQLIPICFSLGTIVALLGLRAWLNTNPEYPARIVPAVVLVAPAHATSTHLLEGYLERAKRLGEQDTPAAVVEFCEEKSPFRKEAEEILAHIYMKTSIILHILYWPNDLLTPYVPSPLRYGSLIEQAVMEREDLTDPAEAVKKHIKVRNDDTTEKELAKILKGYCL